MAPLFGIFPLESSESFLAKVWLPSSFSACWNCNSPECPICWQQGKEQPGNKLKLLNASYNPHFVIEPYGQQQELNPAGSNLPACRLVNAAKKEREEGPGKGKKCEKRGWRLTTWNGMPPWSRQRMHDWVGSKAATAQLE